MLPSVRFDFLEGQKTPGPNVIPRDFDHLLFLFSLDFTHHHKTTLLHLSLSLSQHSPRHISYSI
jgi:hypothetical protein